MAKENKVARFWPKLLSRIIDLVLIGILITVVAFFMLEKVGGKTQFKAVWMFYVWSVIAAFAFLASFILIPILTNGMTIGNFISRVRIKPESGMSLVRVIIKREMFFGWAWIALVVGLATIINHTMIVKVAAPDQKHVKYAGWDSIRLSIFSSFAGIVMLTQCVFGISGLVKADGISLHDKIAGSKVVWINKYVEVRETVKKVVIQPRLVKNNPIEWVGGKKNV